MTETFRLNEKGRYWFLYERTSMAETLPFVLFPEEMKWQRLISFKRNKTGRDPKIYISNLALQIHFLYKRLVSAPAWPWFGPVSIRLRPLAQPLGWPLAQFLARPLALPSALLLARPSTPARSLARSSARPLAGPSARASARPSARPRLGPWFNHRLGPRLGP